MYIVYAHKEIPCNDLKDKPQTLAHHAYLQCNCYNTHTHTHTHTHTNFQNSTLLAQNTDELINLEMLHICRCVHTMADDLPKTTKFFPQHNTIT